MKKNGLLEIIAANRTGDSLDEIMAKDKDYQDALTQQQIADMLNVKQNTYSQYEIGVLNYPLDVVVRLAEYYGTSVDYLLGLTDEKAPYPRRKR